MAKHSRAGGKFRNHTTLIPAAALIADIAHTSASVYRICPGFIKAGLKSVSGNKRVKITHKDKYILLAVRDTTSQQEVHVYVTDGKKAMSDIVRGVEPMNFAVTIVETHH